MEEIKNWWGVFGLFGCVTVVSSSLERRCHRQGSLAALINPEISIHWRTSRECYSLAHAKSARMEICWVSVSLSFFFFFFTGPSIKSVAFCIIAVCVFPLICTQCVQSMCWWVWLLGIVTQSLYQHPILPPPLCVEMVWDCFSMCCCSWTPTSCIGYLQYLSSLCIISALLMICLCRPLKSSTLWNKTPLPFSAFASLTSSSA